MPINIVKVYYNLALVLYIKGLVFKVVIAIFIISTAVNKWLSECYSRDIVTRLRSETS